MIIVCVYCAQPDTRESAIGLVFYRNNIIIIIIIIVIAENGHVKFSGLCSPRFRLKFFVVKPAAHAREYIIIISILF